MIIMVPGGSCRRLSIIIVLLAANEQSQELAEEDRRNKGDKANYRLVAKKIFDSEMGRMMFIKKRTSLTKHCFDYQKRNASNNQGPDDEPDIAFEPAAVVGVFRGMFVVFSHVRTCYPGRAIGKSQ